MSDDKIKPKFDPNKPFDSVETSSFKKESKPKFDPNKEFEDISAQKTKDTSILDREIMGVSPRGLIKGGLEALPMVGGLAGSVIGGGAGFASPIPGGLAMWSAGGAGLGSIAGENLKKLGEKYLLGEDGPKTREEYYGDLGKAGLVGIMSEMGGQIIAVPLGKLGQSLVRYYKNLKISPKANVEQIKEASKRLGFDPTKAMLTESPTIQKLESSLSQSPRFTATPQREAYEKVQGGLRRASEKLESYRTGDSGYELGTKLKTGLQKEVEMARSPVSELYNDINKDLFNIKLQQPIINKNVGVLKRDSSFAGQEGTSFLNKIKSEISELKTVGDLKEYRTNLAKRGGVDDFERMRFDKVYDQITKLRDESIQALKETDPFVKASGKSGKEVIDDLSNKLALADAAHATNIQQLEKIKGIAGITGPVKSQSSFLRNIEKIPEEKLIERAANTNIKTLNEFKERFPDIYESAKTAKVNDLIQKSMDKNGINTTRFIKNVDKLEPEVVQSLFNKEQQQLINDLSLIQKEMPQKIGPSGTPEGLDYKGLLNKEGYLSDIAQSLLLNKVGAIKTTGERLQYPLIKPLTQGLIYRGLENK